MFTIFSSGKVTSDLLKSNHPHESDYKGKHSKFKIHDRSQFILHHSKQYVIPRSLMSTLLMKCWPQPLFLQLTFLLRSMYPSIVQGNANEVFGCFCTAVLVPPCHSIGGIFLNVFPVCLSLGRQLCNLSWILTVDSGGECSCTFCQHGRNISSLTTPSHKSDANNDWLACNWEDFGLKVDPGSYAGSETVKGHCLIC